MKRAAQAFAAAISLLAALRAGAETTREYDRTSGGIVLKVRVSPAAVDPARPFFAEIETDVPSGTLLDIPEPGAFRFPGFETAGSFVDASSSDAARDRAVRRFRLMPVPGARRYALAPFAVSAEFPDGAKSAFPVPGIAFDRAPAKKDAAVPEFGRPLPRPPEGTPAGTLAAFAGAALAGAVVFAALYLPLRFLSRCVRRMLMSPAERAREEMEALALEKLVERGLYKDYFARLALVVRRYMERAHKISAPLMTTPEFLRYAAGSGRFSEKALAMLREFLESADMVKFAAARATPESAGDAEKTVRRYIGEDALEQAARAEAARRAKKTKTRKEGAGRA